MTRADEALRQLRNCGYLGLATKIAQQHHVSPTAMLSARRHPRWAAARAALIWELKRRRHSSPEIADMLGYRDHSSILAAVQKHQRRLDETDAQKRWTVQEAIAWYHEPIGPGPPDELVARWLWELVAHREQRGELAAPPQLRMFAEAQDG